MDFKTIKQSIDINAPKENVWDVLVNNEKNKKWLELFSPGSSTETDWKEGSRAIFKDSSGRGIIGHIAQSKAGELVDIEYDGFIEGDKEDYESEGAKAYKGTHEVYRLSEQNGVTHLDISSEMQDDYYEEMSSKWIVALNKIKELAEKK